MAWTTPGTAVAGEVLTAAWLNTYVRDNTLMGQPVYADEAARDAAIVSPSQGQVCYLTNPTIPAATGDTTFIPTGIITVYDGSVWVCVSDIGAWTDAVGTTTATSYTVSLSGSPGTNPSITLVTGNRALVTLSAWCSHNTGSGQLLTVSVSGATTIAASDSWSAIKVGTGTETAGHTFIIGGLTAGTNTFTLNYRTSGSTFTVSRRRLSVRGLT